MDQDLTTPEGVLRAVLSASANRQFQLLGALLILVVVFVARKLASKGTGKFAAAVRSDLGGVVLSILASAAGAAYAMMKGGAKLDLNLVLSTLTNAAIASGLFTYSKHVKAKAKSMRKVKPAAAPPATEEKKDDAAITTTTTTEKK